MDASWQLPLSATSYFRAAGAFSIEHESEDAGAEAAMALGSVF
ncbi:MAG: hypothetical protein ACOC1F_09670 [Myxococcota bacterium]